MKTYFKATYKVKNRATEPYIGEDGKISWDLPDTDGEHHGVVDDGGDLPNAQSIHNLISQKIHSVVIIPLTEEEYLAAGFLIE